jgi:hypothetical protein
MSVLLSLPRECRSHRTSESPMRNHIFTNYIYHRLSSFLFPSPTYHYRDLVKPLHFSIQPCDVSTSRELDQTLSWLL